MLQVDCSRLNGLRGINETLAHYILESISEEDAAYISAIFDACFRSFQDGSFESRLENVTRLEHSVQVLFNQLLIFIQFIDIILLIFRYNQQNCDQIQSTIGSITYI